MIDSASPIVPRKVCFFLYGLTQGGVPRRTVTLARAMADYGHEVHLVTVAGGNRTEPLPPNVRHVPLAAWTRFVPWVRNKRRRQVAVARPLLARYLQRERPDAIIAADTYANLAAIDVHSRLGPGRPPLIITERKHVSTSAARKPHLIERVRARYGLADAIVGVSEGVAADLVSMGLPAERISAIYNAIDTAAIQAHAVRPIDDPWLAADAPAPVIVAVGRLVPQKGFPTLIRAFARLRTSGFPHRLMILGNGPAATRASLQSLARELGVADHVRLPGHVSPVESYMARAALFVLSSRFEGLPGVLIEALACGTPVVSTDCPSGPREILDGGRFGRLVPVSDDAALAEAMGATLQSPGDRAARIRRAQDFSIGSARAAYDALIDSLQANVPSSAAERSLA